MKVPCAALCEKVAVSFTQDSQRVCQVLTYWQTLSSPLPLRVSARSKTCHVHHGHAVQAAPTPHLSAMLAAQFGPFRNCVHRHRPSGEAAKASRLAGCVAGSVAVIGPATSSLIAFGWRIARALLVGRILCGTFPVIRIVRVLLDIPTVCRRLGR